MTQPDLDFQRARVLEITSDLEEQLDLGWLKIAHLFNEGASEDDAMAETVTKWQYRYAEITWYLYNVMQAPDEAVQGTAIHEYVHVLMGSLDKVIGTKAHAVELTEFAVESIARVIHSALRQSSNG